MDKHDSAPSLEELAGQHRKKLAEEEQGEWVEALGFALAMQSVALATTVKEARDRKLPRICIIISELIKNTIEAGVACYELAGCDVSSIKGITKPIEDALRRAGRAGE